MRAPSFLAAILLVTVAACGGAAVPTTSLPSASAAPSAAPPATAPDPTTTPLPLPTELALGQTIGLFYDPQLERVVLVNGAQERAPARPTELWSWSGSAWELLDTAGPEARSFAAIGHDPVRNVLVVHGGISGSGAAFDETLEWDGRDWTVHQSDAGVPGPREGAGLAHEAATGRMLLFGGAVAFEQQGDTWAWDGETETWERVTQDGPRPRFVSLMTEDRATGDVLLQGGHWVDGNDGDFLADTWRWDGAAWTEVPGEDGPGPRVNSPGTWDDRLGGVVMVGGGTGETAPMASDTWLWRDGWTRIETATAPGPRGGHALAFDAKRQVLVLIGGIAEPGGRQLPEVWELDADGWRQVLPAE